MLARALTQTTRASAIRVCCTRPSRQPVRTMAFLSSKNEQLCGQARCVACLSLQCTACSTSTITMPHHSVCCNLHSSHILHSTCCKVCCSSRGMQDNCMLQCSCRKFVETWGSAASKGIDAAKKVRTTLPAYATRGNPNCLLACWPISSSNLARHMAPPLSAMQVKYHAGATLAEPANHSKGILAHLWRECRWSWICLLVVRAGPQVHGG